jgi:hypothetical protein
MGEVRCGVRYNTGKIQENSCRPNIDGGNGWGGIDLLFIDRSGDRVLDHADGTGAQPESVVMVVERNQQDREAETRQQKKKDISDYDMISGFQLSCFSTHNAISNICPAGLSTF